VVCASRLIAALSLTTTKSSPITPRRCDTFLNITYALNLWQIYKFLNIFRLSHCFAKGRSLCQKFCACCCHLYLFVMFTDDHGVFAYNATPLSNISLTVAIVRPAAGNKSTRFPMTAGGGTTLESRRWSGLVRSDHVTSERQREADTRRRRRAVKAREPEVTSAPLSSSSSSSRSGKGPDYSNDIIDKTIVVLQDTDYDNNEMTTPSEHDYNENDEDWKLVVQLRNYTAVNDSSDVMNMTLNMTSYPPPPDRTYVDTLFKIAHIFHVVGIGILAFFVLQVTAVSIIYT